MATGTLYIIIAPSGGGKTSLVKKLLETTPDIKVSISHTTRPKRPSEQDGVNYYFITLPEFETLVKNNAFLEYATVFGHCYGTTVEWTEKTLAAGIDVILEIDWQGAKIVQEKFPSCISIYILPPSYSILRQRLEARAEDSSAVIAERMEKSKNEIAQYYSFDYLIVNDDFDRALGDLEAIVRANRLTTHRQEQKLAPLLKDLLEKPIENR